MKKKSSILLFFLLLSLLFGCDPNSGKQQVVSFGVKTSLGGYKNIVYTVVNDVENERLSITYESKNGVVDFDAYFSFVFIVVDENRNSTKWSTWDVTHDDSLPLILSCEGGKELTGDNTRHGSYDIKGVTTVYVSYANLSDELKSLCKTYTGSEASSVDYAGKKYVSFKINGFHMINRDYN